MVRSAKFEDNKEIMDLPQSFIEFAVWGFLSLLTGVCAYVAYSVRTEFREIRKDFRDVASSMNLLSVAVAKLTVGLEAIDARMKRLENQGDE